MLDMNKLHDLLIKLEEAAAAHAAASGPFDTDNKKQAKMQAWGAVIQYVADATRSHVPFDEAAARAGKPIEALIDEDWHPVRFVGVTNSGRPVIEGENEHVVSVRPTHVRMAASKMRTYYINASSHGIHGFYLSEDAAKNDGAKRGYPTIAYPIQIPE